MTGMMGKRKDKEKKDNTDPNNIALHTTRAANTQDKNDEKCHEEMKDDERDGKKDDEKKDEEKENERC